jgi:hypothetical protein
LSLGVAAGFVGAAVTAASTWLRTPAWAQAPDVAPLATFIPFFDLALDPVTGFLTRTAVILSALLAVDHFSSGWTRRKMLAIVVLWSIGALGAGTPAGVHAGGWLIGAVLMGAAMIITYATLLRADLTMVPLALGTMMIVPALASGFQRPFPGALTGSMAAALIVGALAWWWFRALRRWRAKVAVSGLHPLLLRSS